MDPLAIDARDLAFVGQVAAGCVRCPLAGSRSRVVFGDGNRSADLMIVGEAPGAEEDAAGVPFVGRAGRVLDELLSGISLSRADVYVANAAMCRPPGNRTPRPDEVHACAPYLDLQYRLVRPRVVLALGVTAAHRLIGKAGSLERLRGRAFALGPSLVVATYHPSGLNRVPARRALAERDFRYARALLDDGSAAGKGP